MNVVSLFISPMLKQKQVSSFLLLPTRFLLGHMIQVSGLGFQSSIKFNLFFYGCTQMENKHQQLLLLSPQDLVLFFDVALKISFLGQTDLLLVHSWPRTNVPPGVVLSAPPPPRIQVNSHSLEKLLIHSRELFPDAPWQELRFWQSCAGLRPNTLSWFWCFSSRWLPKLIPLATKWKREEPEEPWSVTDLLYFALQNKLLQANSQGEL